MPAIANSPGLSDLLAWPTDHLTDAAAHWQAVAGRWYGAFTQVWQDSLSVDWTGRAAEALHSRTDADRSKVSGLVDQLEQAATVARSGASELDAARSRLRSAVEDARSAGFEVGERLSVTDRSAGGTAALRGIRQAQAQSFAADIRWRAAQLVGVDHQVAGKLSEVLAGVGKADFADGPASGIQLVDNRWQQDAPPDHGPPAPDGQHLLYCYPSARPDFWWCEGYEVGKGPYAFDFPIDISGIG
jgi:hypothetical protein